MTTYSKDTVFKLKALGVYQLLFAVAGCILTIVLMVRTGLQYWQVTVLFAVAFALYFYALLCGIFCWQQKKEALPYSLVNQYLQLVSFSIVGYGFKYFAVLALYVGVDLTNNFFVNFNLEVVSSWTILFASSSDAIVINFNLVAMAVIIIINKLSKIIAAEDADREVLDIGSGA